MPNRSYDHVLGFALSHPWNLEPGMLSVIAGVLARRIAGVDVDQSAIEAALVNRKNLPQPRAGSLAIIPVYGVLAPRMNLMSDMSGGTTYEKLTGQIRAAVADKTIKTIVLDIDSPGGSVAGNAELASEIMKARTKKPIVAQAQYTMGSAAYQIGSACTEVVAAPSASVGSVGTFWLHRDLSEALKQLGVKETYLSAGEGKVDGNSSGPMSEYFQARMQATIDAAYGAFVSNVVKGRGAGMTGDRVKKDWKAHVYSAPDALANGMIDAIATLDDTIARLLTASPDAADQRAALDFASTDATDQELPRAATSQERQDEIAWQNARERELLELSL